MFTEKLYYKDAYIREFDAEVLSCTAGDDHAYRIVLDRTAFYPEGGGQPGDSGFIGDIRVTDTIEKNDEILHICSSPLQSGSRVHCGIDWDRRLDHMQQHTGEHIISGMICSELHCDNVGFHMGEDTVTIDYNAYADPDRILDIEAKANRYILEDHPAEISFPDREQLSGLPYRSKKELEGEVRIVSFPGADTCACCGTHLSSSAQVGLIKVLSHKKFHEGIRLEIVCGQRAVDYLMTCWRQNSAVGRELSSPYDHTHSALLRYMEQTGELKKKIAALEDEVCSLTAAGYADAGDTYIIRGAMESDSLRRLCEAVYSVCGGICAVFSGSGTSYRYALRAPDDRLSGICRSINSALNGRGGGRDGLAQGSVSADEQAIRAYFE